MSSYFVVAQDGQKYGPADIAALNQWIAEGRILPTTMLEDSVSGARIVARALNGLIFPQDPSAPTAFRPTPAPPGANPYSTPSISQQYQMQQSYPRQQPWNQPAPVNQGEIVAGWVCTCLTPLIFCLCFVPFATAIFGLVIGLRLQRQGMGQGTVMMTLNMIWLLLLVAFHVYLSVSTSR